MLTENDVWIMALVGMGLVALIFIWVAAQAGKPPRPKAMSPHGRVRLRRSLFAVLLVLFAAATWASLKSYPIPPQHAHLDAGNTHQVVNVVGHQWRWDMSAYQVVAGRPVEFRVTSDDVNHDFAVYDPQGRIVTQVQAMPGYTNKDVYTFTKPGVYVIRCLEYCGLGHAVMETRLRVVAAPTPQAA